MAQFSPIGWTGGSWNIYVGCWYAGSDCTRCYLADEGLRLAEKLKIKKYEGVARLVKGIPVLTGRVNYGGEDVLNLPRRWRRAQKIFVNSMGDLFHHKISLGQIKAVFQVMRECPWHLFQILTKRAERLAELAPFLDWPPNVWIGVSCGHSQYYDRIRLLQTVPTDNLFLSLEPMIGPLSGLPLDRIRWVIMGGESGRRHRPVNADWLRDVRDQVTARGIALFFKQWGGRTAKSGGNTLDGRRWLEYPWDDSQYAPKAEEQNMDPDGGDDQNQRDDLDDEEDESDGDRPADNKPEKKAGFSPFKGAKTDEEWLRRGQEIAKGGVLDIIKKTEQEYMPLGEVAAHFERTLPWKKAGVTKKVWVETRSNIENCSVVHWNQCLKIYGLRDNWEKAKQRYLTRNVSWRPKHSSSPLFAQDLLDDYRDRDLGPKATVKAPERIKGSVWQQRFYAARDELKRVAAIHDYESPVLKALDEQVAKDAAIDPVVLASTEDVEKRMARANAIRAMGSSDKSESRESMERMLDEWEASMERFEVAGIEVRPISKDFVPSPTEMASKFRLLRDREAALRAENADAQSKQEANFPASKIDRQPTAEVLALLASTRIQQPAEWMTAFLKKLDDAVDITKGWSPQLPVDSGKEPVTPPLDVAVPVRGEAPKKRGAKRKAIVDVKHLKLVAAREIKDGLAQPDLTLAKLKAKLDPVWDSLDIDGFEGGEAMTAFRRFVWDRLQAKAKERGFPLDGLNWHDQSGFEIVQGDHGGDDPDDDPPKGGPPAPSTQASDGEARDPATPTETQPETPPETGSDKAIQTIEQLNAALQSAIQTIRAMPDPQFGPAKDKMIHRACDLLKEIWTSAAPHLYEHFVWRTALDLRHLSRGPKPEGEVLFWRDRPGGSSVEMISIMGPKAGPTVSFMLPGASPSPEVQACLHIRNERLADLTESDLLIDPDVAERLLKSQGRIGPKAVETRKRFFGVVGKIVALGAKMTPKAAEIFAELERRPGAYWTKHGSSSFNAIISEYSQQQHKAKEQAKPRHVHELSDRLVNAPESWRQDFDGWPGRSLSGNISRRGDYQELLALSSKAGDTARMKYCQTVISWLNEKIVAKEPKIETSTSLVISGAVMTVKEAVIKTDFTINGRSIRETTD